MPVTLTGFCPEECLVSAVYSYSKGTVSVSTCAIRITLALSPSLAFWISCVYRCAWNNHLPMSEKAEWQKTTFTLTKNIFYDPKWVSDLFNVHKFR